MSSHTADLDFESGPPRVDHLIDHRTVVFEARARPCGAAVELVLEAIGGDSLRKGYRLLAPTDRLGMFGVSSAVANKTGGMFGMLSMLASTPWLQFNPLSLMNANSGVFGVNWGVRRCPNSAHPAYRALAARRPHAARSGPPKRGDGGPQRPRPRRLRTSESAGRPIGRGRRCARPH